MKVAEILAPHLPANADRNEKIDYAICWRLFCTEHFSREDEFMDRQGVLTTLDVNMAYAIAQKFGKTEAQGSFTIDCNRLLHVSGVSFQTLVAIAKPNSLDCLINELLLSLSNHFSGFGGIHFKHDGVVFVRRPETNMNTNSFKLFCDN